MNEQFALETKSESFAFKYVPLIHGTLTAASRAAVFSNSFFRLLSVCAYAKPQIVGNIANKSRETKNAVELRPSVADREFALTITDRIDAALRGGQKLMSTGNVTI